MQGGEGLIPGQDPIGLPLDVAKKKKPPKSTIYTESCQKKDKTFTCSSL